MTPTEAATALALLDRLWPKSELTTEVREALVRRLAAVDITYEQFAAVAEELRVTSRYRSPSTADLLARCKAAAPKPHHDAVEQNRRAWKNEADDFEQSWAGLDVPATFAELRRQGGMPPRGAGGAVAR